MSKFLKIEAVENGFVVFDVNERDMCQRGKCWVFNSEDDMADHISKLGNDVMKSPIKKPDTAIK